jgi:translation initiation factor IF-2
MSDANDNDNGRNPGTRAPLSLKPRQGAVSAGTVKQSFSHGRSKTVVVETKRRRVDGPAGPAVGLGGPSAAEKRFDAPKPQAPAAPRPAPGPGAASANLNLSAEELKARQRVLETARAEQDRRDA